MDGEDLRGTPLSDRKKLLKEVLKANELVRSSEYCTGSGPEILEAVKAQGLEGVIAKRPDSVYESRRSPDWVKWKVVDTASLVICGFTPGEGSRSGENLFGALV